MPLHLEDRDPGHLVFLGPETDGALPARLGYQSGDGPPTTIPMIQDRLVVCAPWNHPTFDAAAECWEHGLGLALCKGARIHLLASARGPDPAQAQLRRRQHARYRDPAWRLDFVRHLVDAKAMAQIQVLGRIQRERSTPAHAPVLVQVLRDLDRARNGLGFHRSIEALRGAEGHMALRYFSALAILAGQDDFHRLPRIASDPFNLLLDIAYSRVAQAMSLALIERGVDLGLGALHADGDGRPTTALDLMEPLRPLMADRWVLSMWRHPNREHWFSQEPGNPRWTLSPAGRTAIRTRWARWQFGSALVVGQMRRITTIVDWWQHALHQPHIPQYSPIA